MSYSETTAVANSLVTTSQERIGSIAFQSEEASWDDIDEDTQKTYLKYIRDENAINSTKHVTVLKAEKVLGESALKIPFSMDGVANQAITMLDFVEYHNESIGTTWFGGIRINKYDTSSSGIGLGNYDYPGRDEGAFISYSLADEIIASSKGFFSSYDDLLGKPFSLSFESFVLRFSINNIFIQEDPSGYALPVDSFFGPSIVTSLRGLGKSVSFSQVIFASKDFVAAEECIGFARRDSAVVGGFSALQMGNGNYSEYAQQDAFRKAIRLDRTNAIAPIALWFSALFACSCVFAIPVLITVRKRSNDHLLRVIGVSLSLAALVAALFLSIAFLILYWRGALLFYYLYLGLPTNLGIVASAVAGVTLLAIDGRRDSMAVSLPTLRSDVCAERAKPVDTSWKTFFRQIKELFVRKEVLAIGAIVCLFAFLILFLAFDRRPYNIIYNTALVLGAAILLVRSILRSNYRFDGIVVVFLWYGIWSTIASLLAGKATYVYLLHIFAFISVYWNVAELEREKRYLCYRLIGLAFNLFTLIVLAFYFPYLLSKLGIGSATFVDKFGNSDRVSSSLATALLLNLYFLRKKDFVSGLFIIVQVALVLMFERRLAFLNVGIGLVIFLYSLFPKGKKAFFFISLGAVTAIGIAVLQAEPFSGIRDRLWSAIVAIITKNHLADDSTWSRIELLVQSYRVGFATPFFGYGYEGIVQYSFSPAHDSFGSVALAAGWVLSLSMHACLFYWLFRYHEGIPEDRLPVSFFTMSLVLAYFLGTPFESRMDFVIYPVIFAIIANRDPLYLRSRSYIETRTFEV